MCDVVKLTRDLVRIPSVNPSYGTDAPEFCGEGRLADYLATFLGDRGFVVHRFEPMPGRPYLVACRAGKGKALAFCAHLDTVPVGDMTIPPFEGIFENGVLYGRGALDDKAGIAAAVAATLAENDPDAPPVILALTCDEEFGFTGVDHFVRQTWPEMAGCIVCEPTDGVLVLGHKGVYRATVRTRGTSAHSSTPHLGDNAIYRMRPVLERLEALADTIAARSPHAKLGTGSLCVGTIAGGSAVNAVPADCHIQLDRRTLPGETAAAMEAEVRAALAGCPSWELSVPFMDAPSFCQDAEAPFARLVTNATTLPVGYVNYATDGATIFYHGIPTIVFGPGDIAVAHTKDECVSAEALETTVAHYRAILRALARANAAGEV